MKKFIYFLILVILSLTFLKGFAYFVPDINLIGKDPEILSLEPGYLTPGQEVKIIGKNFFAFPKSANKLYINNRPVRVIKARNDSINFLVPKLPIGKVKIKLFIYYMGYKSSEFVYPQKENEFIPVKFHAPSIQKTNTLAVKPNMPIQVYGKFNTNDDLFFKIGEQEFKADLISKGLSQIQLPTVLPKGPF